jgi:glycosyltransferase involved in cell wall biosynthesis
MKVAYVTMQFPATTETFAGTDVRVLRETGVDVHVFAMRPRHRDHARMLRERGLVNVPVSTLTVARYLMGLVWMLMRPHWAATLVVWNLRHHASRPRALLRCFALVPSAMSIFSRLVCGKFEVIHLFWGHFPSMVGHLAQRFAPDVVASVFLGAYDLDTDRYGSWLPGAVPVARGADVVWTHSRTNIPRLLALGIAPTRLRCVYRGVDLKSLPMSGAGSRAAGSVVTVGALIERKGVDETLRAFARVLSDLTELHLDVLGDGPERASLEALATALGVRAHVSFHGQVSTATVTARLMAATAFVLLSRADRIPNVVKEAMAVGCPCIVTHTQGMEELVDHGRTGYMVPVGDVDAAATHLSAILTDPERHAVMASAARVHVVEHFSAEASMAAYVEGWRGALTARRSGVAPGAPSGPPGQSLRRPGSGR